MSELSHLKHNTLPIALGYAEALFDIAVANNTLDEVKTELEKINDIVLNTPGLAHVLAESQFSGEHSIAQLIQPLTDAVSSTVSNTLILMVKSHHSAGIVSLYDGFLPHYEKANRIGHIYIETAVEISESTKTEITRRLKALFQLNEAKLKHHVNPERIGGLYVEYQGLRLDASLSRKLESLKLQLSSI